MALVGYFQGDKKQESHDINILWLFVCKQRLLLDQYEYRNRYTHTDPVNFS